jgi:hypothetical protein
MLTKKILTPLIESSMDLKKRNTIFPHKAENKNKEELELTLQQIILKTCFLKVRPEQI